MAEDDFACEKFVAQKRRADVCRNCYQPLKLHTKKQPVTDSDKKKNIPGIAAASQSVPKVLEKFGKKRDSSQALGSVAVTPQTDVSPQTHEKDVSPQTHVSPQTQQQEVTQQQQNGTRSPSLAPSVTMETGTTRRGVQSPTVLTGKVAGNASKYTKPSLIPAKPPPPPLVSNSKKSYSPPVTSKFPVVVKPASPPVTSKSPVAVKPASPPVTSKSPVAVKPASPPVTSKSPVAVKPASPPVTSKSPVAVKPASPPVTSKSPEPRSATPVSPPSVPLRASSLQQEGHNFVGEKVVVPEEGMVGSHDVAVPSASEDLTAAIPKSDEQEIEASFLPVETGPVSGEAGSVGANSALKQEELMDGMPELPSEQDEPVQSTPPSVQVPPAVSPPPAASPPPAKVSPPPAEVSPPPAEVSPPPAEVSPPPAEVSPPPAEVSPPPAEVSPPPAEVSPPPAEVSLPPAEVSPPPTEVFAEVSPPPAEVSPPPAAVLPPPAAVSPPPAEVSPPPAEVSPPPAEVSLPPAEVSPPPAELSLPPAEVSPPPAEVSPPPAAVSPPPAAVSPPPAEISPPPAEVSPPPMPVPPELSPPPEFSAEVLPPPVTSGEPSPHHSCEVHPPPPLFADIPLPMTYPEDTPPPHYPAASPPPPPLSFAGDPEAPPPPAETPPPHVPTADIPGAPPPPPPIPADGIPVPPPPPAIPRQVPRPQGSPAALHVPPPDSAMAQAMAAIRSGGVSLRAVPPPVEGPVGVMAQTLAAIRSGGVTLRAVPPPTARPAGEDKVVDVASELRHKMMQRRKKESEGVGVALEASREEVEKMKNLLLLCRGTHSFSQQLKTLLARVDQFLEHVELPQQVLSQRLGWPIELVHALRDVVGHMELLDQRVRATELLCQQTLASCQSGGPGGSAVPVNSDAVEKCVGGVVRLAKDLITDESRYSVAARFFPVAESDIQTFIERAGVAVQPLLELLYQRAFATHDSIFEPSVTHFDKRFRVQNAQRLMKLCCSLSDAISLHLNVPRHPDYSQAQLKQKELRDNLASPLRDSAEGHVAAPKPLDHTTENTEEVQRLVACLAAAQDADCEAFQLTPDKLAKMEVELVKAVLSSSDPKVIDAALALRGKVYCGDEIAAHRCDFDWLLNSVVKGDHERIEHLVGSCGLNVNSRDREVGNSLLHRAVQRKDLATAACLIRAGADPLLKNSRQQSPLRLLAITCFPATPSPQHSTHVTSEPLFQLTGYVDNPSLSDVVLVAEDGSRFFAHRLVLCAQSQVFKAMLDSDLWAGSRNKEVPLPTVGGRVLKHLLQYLYTGSCLYPRDDLNLGLDLMGVADQFMLDSMKLQCELLLGEKIDPEVVVPLYYAASRYNTARLLSNTSHFLLNHYAELDDPQHEVLLHLLENATPGGAPQQEPASN